MDDCLLRDLSTNEEDYDLFTYVTCDNNRARGDGDAFNIGVVCQKTRPWVNFNNAFRENDCAILGPKSGCSPTNRIALTAEVIYKHNPGLPLRIFSAKSCNHALPFLSRWLHMRLRTI